MADVIDDFQIVARDLSFVLKDQKISYADKVGIIADYWLGKVGALPRRFDYQQGFPVVQAGCRPKFARKVAKQERLAEGRRARSKQKAAAAAS